MSETNYKQFTSIDSNLSNIVPEKFWDYVTASGKFTVDKMAEEWKWNLRKNLKTLYKEHGSVTQSFLGFGANKAVIGVGAGPSFAKNKDVLKKVFNYNSQYTLQDQPFIIIASNHQFKPLLDMGIFPHFVMLSDGGGHVYDQLCKDIPDLGKRCILISTLNANHKILRDWDAQGRKICFYLPDNPKAKKIFRKATHEDADQVSIAQGGNVLNSSFLLSMKILHSSIFMALGNDLSYTFDPDLEARRSGFYADGDYSTNIGSKRDEAQDRMTWLGIEFVDDIITPGHKVINLKPVLTSRQLFIYKVWAEMHVGAWANQLTFQYYNCSEGGICGVVAKDHNNMGMFDLDNWQLMDDIYPKRWRTRTLADAVEEFLKARDLCRITEETSIGVESAVGSLVRTGFAKNIELSQ